jgi:hypothetical protein
MADPYSGAPDDATRDLFARLHALINATDPATPGLRFQDQPDLFAFILDNLPYGVVTHDNVQWGLIEVDGPASSTSIDTGASSDSPPLYWYFRGRPHEIASALHLQYSYTRQAQTGTEALYAASIFIGFEVPRATTPAARADLREASLADLLTSMQRSLDARRPTARLIAPRPAGNDFLELVLRHTPKASPAPLASDDLEINVVEYDGVARDYSSINPFPYNLSQVVMDASLYNQMLYWYFGGRAYRITKAMRTRLASLTPVEPGSLNEQMVVYIGFQGPSM